MPHLGHHIRIRLQDDRVIAPTVAQRRLVARVQLDGNEECDSANLNSQTCESQGFAGGTLACTGGCLFDTSGCLYCGDGQQNGTEQCDGFDLGGATCQSAAGEQHGNLSCTATCTLDTSACHTCGNGGLEGPVSFLGRWRLKLELWRSLRSSG